MAEQPRLVAMVRTCGLCNHIITKECNAGGVFYKHEEVWLDIKLCHPDNITDEHQDCYHLYTVYGKRRDKNDEKDFIADIIASFTDPNGVL